MSEKAVVLTRANFRKYILGLIFIIVVILIIASTTHLGYRSNPTSEEDLKLQLRRYEELKRMGAKVLNVPFVRQKPWFCSEASASMVLRFYGFNVTQDDVSRAGYTSFEDMLPFLRRYIQCEYAILTLDDLRREIDLGRPVIIRILPGQYLHTIVVVGYNDNYFYVHDPAIGPYVKMEEGKLLSVWKANKCKAIIIRGPRKC